MGESMKPLAMREASLADYKLNRRRFLQWGALAAAMGLSPHAALSNASGLQAPERSLAFYNTHTGERLSTVYWIQGKYLPEALADVDYVLRDHRTDEVKAIDLQLLDLLHAIGRILESQRPFYIISGYRSAATNAYLRFFDGGVAEHSLHVDGKAVDIRLPGCATINLRHVAVALRAGGVGYYRRSDFVHIDVGRIRYW
jgi:uncharacterized protein YcbK (DUF882 family)